MDYDAQIALCQWSEVVLPLHINPGRFVETKIKSAQQMREREVQLGVGKTRRFYQRLRTLMQNDEKLKDRKKLGEGKVKGLAEERGTT